jgi:hypothetical protein
VRIKAHRARRREKGRHDDKVRIHAAFDRLRG